MKIAHFVLETPLFWRGENVCTLVLENKKFYRQTVSKLIEQSVSGIGDFVLSEDDEILAFDKYVQIISDIFCVDASIDKFIVTNVQKDVAKSAQFEMPIEMTELFAHINHFMSRLCCAYDSDIVFDDINDIAGLLKLYRLRPDCEGLCLIEKLLLYMELQRKYSKKRLFVIVNLKSCLTNEEIDRFFKDVLYRKLNLLCVESLDGKTCQYESKIILDNDMCQL